MIKSKNVFIVIAAIVGVIFALILFIMAIIGAQNLTDGCLSRYSEDNQEQILTKSIVLKGNGNYNTDNANLNKDDSYGQWRNTNIKIESDSIINTQVKGEVSLCKAYLPKYNLQSHKNTDIDNNAIPIPRVNEVGIEPLSLIFNAQTDEWRNIASISKHDHVMVYISKGKYSIDAKEYDVFNRQYIQMNCQEGLQTYHPICGRYSFWKKDEYYVDKCELLSGKVFKKWKDTFPSNAKNLISPETNASFNFCYNNGCNVPIVEQAPVPYKGKQSIVKWSRDQDIAKLTPNLKPDCFIRHDYVNDKEYQDSKKFWFSSGGASGLLYRLNNNLYSSNSKYRGTDFKVSQGQSSFGSEDQVIFNEEFKEDETQYLQYRFLDKGDFSSHTGGYVLKVRQTKCRYINGHGGSEQGIRNYGGIEYAIKEYGSNPNNSGDLNVKDLITNPEGLGQIEVSNQQKGYLWMRIKNNKNNYKDSVGSYKVSIEEKHKPHTFIVSILNPLLDNIKGTINNIYITMFKNMTCYKGVKGSYDSCTNFFNYIRGILVLYIMFYGISFLMGSENLTQKDFIMRVIKIAIVAGLINGSTFEFFSKYVFHFVTNFSDDIISNISGYTSSSTPNNASNPFMFLDEVMTKMFLSKTFAAQVMSTLSMGLSGLMYFVLIFISMSIMIVVIMRAIAVYIMALMCIAVLLALTPIVLTCMLFQTTWYIFENWTRFLFKYMIEPVVLLAGIIILTQLFTIYIDYIIGYSVCWKCAIPIKIPFVGILGEIMPFLDIEIFCINWFVPWGVDTTEEIGMHMTNMIVLMMIAYCMWGYTDFSGMLVSRLAQGGKGASATSMGQQMSKGFAGMVKNNAITKYTTSAVKGTASGLMGVVRGDTTQKPKIEDSKNKGSQDDIKRSAVSTNDNTTTKEDSGVHRSDVSGDAMQKEPKSIPKVEGDRDSNNDKNEEQNNNHKEEVKDRADNLDYDNKKDA